MLNLLKKYSNKIVDQGLSDLSDIIYLALDDHIYFYPPEAQPVDAKGAILRKVFDLININTLLYAIPKDPYKGIINSVLKRGTVESDSGRKIVPQDCETRTFFHDFPVIDRPDAEKIASVLSERKSVVIADGPAVVSYGSVSAEQAFVSLSSTCFSLFVKYFYDFLLYTDDCSNTGKIAEKERTDEFRSIWSCVSKMPPFEREGGPHLFAGPPKGREEEMQMLIDAGRRVVEEGLVDSYFGNISSYHHGKILISETASSLDELEGAIDAVPTDGSSSVGITASSEVSTHREVFAHTDARVILHGHPKFSVIMSMYCTKECDMQGECYKVCPEDRSLCSKPIVPGEVGTGPTGIVNTVPTAFKNSDAVIVYGHGVFCRGEKDFNQPFGNMMEIETCSRDHYIKRVGSAL